MVDGDEAVVFGDAVGSGEGAGFDLAGIGGNREVGNESIFGFTRAVGDDGFVVIGFGKIDGIESFSEGSDLIEFDEDGIWDVFVDTAL